MNLSPSRSSLFRTATTAMVGAVVGLGLLATPSALASSSQDPVQAVNTARSTLQRAQREREAAEARLSQLRDRKALVQAEIAELDRSDAALTTELAEARRQVREFAVAAYIDGGQTEMVRASLSPEQAAALSWRTGLVSGQAGSASDAAERFDALRSSNDPDRLTAAEELDRVSTDEAEALSDLMQASAQERDADAALAAAARTAAAQQAAADRRAAVAAAAAAPAPKPAAPVKAAAKAPKAPKAPKAAKPVPSTTSTGGTVGGAAIGDATPEELAFLAQVRKCESHGNYSIVSSTGRYRGAYQFSVQTWQGVGGSGDPAAASPAEQDMRALKLLRLQGKRAWPVCSR